MLLFLLFAATVAAECETGTCGVCKNMTGCGWYGWDCYNKSGTVVSSLNIPESSSCDPCQAGNCTDCTAQVNCSWFKNDIPGAPGKCAATDSSQTFYTQLDVCPPCDSYATCDACSAANETCGWYELAGTGGKCREAAPSFAYSKVKLGFCSGDPCAGQKSCSKCAGVRLDSDNTTVLCAWYTSKSPTFYDSKCDSVTGGAVSTAFYNPTPSCPVCAATSCVECKEDPQCKWVAVLGAFGQCLKSTDTTPTGKSEVATCPAACKVHSCTQCQTNPACSWFTGGFVDDSCDLSKDAVYHPGQNPAQTCPKCAADRCFECNGLAGCGWYAEIKAGITFREGCYDKATPPSGRTLIENSNSKCDGVSSSAHVAVSMVLLVALALVA